MAKKSTNAAIRTAVAARLSVQVALTDFLITHRYLPCQITREWAWLVTSAILSSVNLQPARASKLHRARKFVHFSVGSAMMIGTKSLVSLTCGRDLGRIAPDQGIAANFDALRRRDARW
jgi:hypothetical protein